MTKLELRSTLSLATLFAFRLLGLFMILPVFSVWAPHYANATPKLIGMALGSYGLTQACLQIPFGLLSDRFGRKPMITIGFILFAAGSMWAACAHSMLSLVFARALQGAGAIGSVLIALLADLTSEENRSKALAILGMIIGLSFLVAMILGPITAAHFGLMGIFWLTSLFALIGLIILYFFVPTPQQLRLHGDVGTIPSQFLQILKNRDLLRLDFGIMALHGILTSSFLALPILLQQQGILAKQAWLVYLPVLILAFISMLPFMIIGEKKRQLKKVFIGAILLIALAELLFYFGSTQLPWLIFALFLFMTAFSLLEASLPSLVSKVAPAGSKGTAMGIYSSSQFLGIFLGGVCGGILHSHFSLSSLFLACLIIAMIWSAVALTMKTPPNGMSK